MTKLDLLKDANLINSNNRDVVNQFINSDSINFIDLSPKLEFGNFEEEISVKDEKESTVNILKQLEEARKDSLETLKTPKSFEDKIKGTLANKPRGKMHKWLWSKLSLIFIPKNEKKTLAEMSYKKFKKWRNTSYASWSSLSKFGKWYSKK